MLVFSYSMVSLCASSFLLTSYDTSSSAVHHLFWISWLLATSLGDISTESPRVCNFPNGWQGGWYESGIGEVQITSDSISRKGTCLENRTDYYLLENREIGCYTCLQITPRHNNVIQYKESFCIGQQVFEKVCSTIHTETVQRTLIRDGGSNSYRLPSPCPFKDVYHFIYSNTSRGTCRTPMSYMTPCASDSHLRMRFRHCPEAAYTYEQEADLYCLASWSDGLHSYLVGRILGTGFVGKEGQYRCLLYQILGSVVHAAMSADASCRGLISPRDGPILMEFTQDTFGWPASQCHFPRWVQDDSWRDLAGVHSYQVNDRSDILRQIRNNSSSSVSVPPATSSSFSSSSSSSASSLFSSLSSAAGAVKSFRCLQGLYEMNSSQETLLLLSFVYTDCSSSYSCLRIVRRSAGILELTENKYSPDHRQQFCLDASQFSSTEVGSQLLLSSSLFESSDAVSVAGDRRVRCPAKGRYSIHTGASHCRSYFRSNCNDDDVVDIVSTCSSRPGLQLSCIKTWYEDHKQFLLAQVPGNNRLSVNCFSFRPKGQTLLFSVDLDCNHGVPYLIRDRVTYVMNRNPIPCDTVTVASKSVSQDSGVTNEADELTLQMSGLRRQQMQRNSTTAKINDAARQSRQDEKKERPSHSGSFGGDQRTRLTLITVVASLAALINYVCDHLTTLTQC